MPKRKHTPKDKSPSPHAKPLLGDDDEMNLSKYVTTDQAAQILGVLPTSINHLIYEGKVKAFKAGRDWLVFQPSLEKYLANKSKRGRPTSKTPQLKTQSETGQE